MTFTLLVHGALSTKNSFSFIRKSLPTDFVFKDFSYDVRTEYANETVSRLTQRALGCIKEDATLNIIGHSFGGVLAIEAGRALMKIRPDLKLNIITMATPFGGSPIASLMLIGNPMSIFYRNIGTFGSFMRDSMSNGLPCKTTSFITVEGSTDLSTPDNDGVVTLSSQLHHKNDPNFNPFRVKLNHFEVLLSEDVSEKIRKVCMEKIVGQN